MAMRENAQVAEILGDQMPAENKKAKPASTDDLLRQCRPFLSAVTIDFGPRQLLSDYFLVADQMCRERGLDLVFAPASALKTVNEQNNETWMPLLPLFDTDEDADDDNTFCILGLNPIGEVVATQAARIYSVGTSVGHAMEDLSFFYRDPSAARLQGVKCEVTAPSARDLYGRVVFSGGGWYRRDYRKRGLFELLPRISRALAFTRWQSDHTMSIMAEGVIRGGRAAACGYRDIDWAVLMDNFPMAPHIRAALVAMNTKTLFDDLEGALADAPRDTAHGAGAQVDAFVENRA